MGIYSTLDHLHALGAKDGRERGLCEGACRQLGKLLLRHGKRRLGPPTPAESALLDALIDRAGVEQMGQAVERFATAPGWPEMLAGIEPPAARPADPEYLLPLEIDPSPLPPSIDEYAKVKGKSTGLPSIVHIRLQRLYQDNIGAVLHRESQRLRKEYHCPVHTAVLLLWPGADGPAMTGEYDVPTGGTFQYHLNRLWEKDVDELFSSLATVAYTPLGKGAPERLPEIVRRMEEIIDSQAPDERMRENLWVVAYQGMGLRYPAERVNELLAHKLPFIYATRPCRGTLSEGFYDGHAKGLEEGMAQATRRWVRTLGGQRLGEPSEELMRALEAVSSLDRLEQIAARALHSASWPAVLAPN
jgi:hypothetical protein